MDRKTLIAQAGLGVILAATVAALATSVDVETLVEPGISMVLPDNVGRWAGESIEVSQVEREYLPSDTQFAKKLYRDPLKRVVFLSIVMSGKDRASIHRPEVCLPAQGFTPLRSDVVQIPVEAPGGRQLEATRILLKRDITLEDGSQRTVGYFYLYWFVGKNRVTASHLDRVLLNTLDRALHGVSHQWAYVSYLMPIYDSIEDSADLLSRFVVDSYPQFGTPDDPPAAASAAAPRRVG